jgi:hypothetical protein
MSPAASSGLPAIRVRPASTRRWPCRRVARYAPREAHTKSGGSRPPYTKPDTLPASSGSSSAAGHLLGHWKTPAEVTGVKEPCPGDRDTKTATERQAVLNDRRNTSRRWGVPPPGLSPVSAGCPATPRPAAPGQPRRASPSPATGALPRPATPALPCQGTRSLAIHRTPGPLSCQRVVRRGSAVALRVWSPPPGLPDLRFLRHLGQEMPVTYVAVLIAVCTIRTCCVLPLGKAGSPRQMRACSSSD